MLEIIFCTNRKCEAVSKLLSQLEDAVSPVIGSFRIPYIIYTVVCYKVGQFEVIDIVSLPVAHQTMTGKKDYNLINLHKANGLPWMIVTNCSRNITRNIL
jgi:hypothetical protein